MPEFPARDFCEALQAVHFVTFCLCAGQQMLLFQLGRPDRYLLPLYRRDLAAGRITPDEALEWIDCLALMLSEYTPRGLAVGWMVGGRDASGADVCNELTDLFLQQHRPHAPLLSGHRPLLDARHAARGDGAVRRPAGPGAVAPGAL